MDIVLFDPALRPGLWVMAGLGLMLGELVLGGGILLSLGVAGLLTAGWLALQAFGYLPEALILVESWRSAAVLYCLLALPSVFLIRRFPSWRTRQRDINDY